jgi:glycosidase
VLRRYCGHAGDGLHLVFLFKSLRTAFTARAFRDLVHEFEAAFPDPLHPTYVFGNHDRPRHMERLGNDPAKARLLAAFQLTVRGVPFVYYGEELGMPHHDGLPRQEAKDPLAARMRFVPTVLLPALRRRGILVNRDECRSPMPWHGGAHAGFSSPGTARTWLPVHPCSATVNVAAQRDDPASVLAAYRRMLALRRRSPALSGGRLELLEPPADPGRILAYRRVSDAETAEVFLNFSARETPLDLRERAGRRTHSNLRDEPFGTSGRHVLQPWEAVVLFDHR